LSEEVTTSIIDFWRSRWLSGRIELGEKISDVEGNSLSLPVRHGARVVLPGDPSEEPLFALGFEAAALPTINASKDERPSHGFSPTPTCDGEERVTRSFAIT
jgi:hypothetical protein